MISLATNTPGSLRRVSVFDTTLRDGEQAPGNAMSPEQKLKIALRIEELGVDLIETGFPASSPSEFTATRLISQHLTSARFVTFCRAVRRDVETAVEAGGVANHQVQIMATGSDLHLEHKRGITRRQAIDEVVEAVEFARALGLTDVSIPIEDASRGDVGLLREITVSAIHAGATSFVLGDTSGCLLPAEYGALVAMFRQWAPPPITISTHCHDDFGLATANAVAGVQAGANEVQVTLGGIGERAGNTPLEEFVALAAYKRDQLGFYTDVNTELMYAAYSVLRGAIDLAEPRNKAIFGTYAFGTAAGVHQQGMLTNPATYEYVEASRFGRERSILISRHSGRVVLRHLLEQLEVQVDDTKLSELYEAHIAARGDGGCERLEDLRDRLLREFAVAEG
jgi:2-isopropylmalate synthase